MTTYIIDVESHDVKTLIRKLKRLKSTIAIMNDNVILTLLFIIFGYLMVELSWEQIVKYFQF